MGEGSRPVMALRTSRAASSLASMEACSLYQDVWGVQIRLGASFSGPCEKLGNNMRKTKVIFMTTHRLLQNVPTRRSVVLTNASFEPLTGHFQPLTSVEQQHPSTVYKTALLSFKMS